MRLFSKKKEEKKNFFENSYSDDFDINDIDLPPLPDEMDYHSKKLPNKRDLPPLPEPPKPMNYYHSLPKKHIEPQETHPQKSVLQKRTIHTEENEHPFHKKVYSSKAPVFVRIDKYKEAISVIRDLKEDLDKLNSALDSIKSAKKQEEEIISGWTGLLSELSSKLNKINTHLFEPDNE